jgi:hypothetical protein
MAANRNDDNWRKQNYKTAGDRWGEGSDEKSVLHKGRDDGYKAPRDISTRGDGSLGCG